MQSSKAKQFKLTIRPFQEPDIPAADQVFRLAFGTFIGLPDPMTFSDDAAFIRTRYLINPAAGFVAEADGRLIGSNLATNWGRLGFFGPLTIHPDFWDKGVAQRLLEPTMELFDRWQIRHAGLYTFAQSAKHVGLYQKFGFWPRYLTMLITRPVAPVADKPQWSPYSTLLGDEKEEALRACRELADHIYEGLDLTREIGAVDFYNSGDTVLLWERDNLAGFAVCHCGPGTEAPSNICYIKFGAVRSGAKAGANFPRLLAACSQMAAERGLAQILAGVNTARSEAYQQMLAQGFRTTMQGVIMQKPNEPGYNRPDVYLIDDWR